MKESDLVHLVFVSKTCHIHFQCRLDSAHIWHSFHILDLIRRKCLSKRVKDIHKVFWTQRFDGSYTLLTSLTSLTFGDFNGGQLLVLPNSLKYLDLGRTFNQPLTSATFPNSLTHLGFGRAFNQSLTPGMLPTSLETIRFGMQFDQPLTPGVFGNVLKSLEFGYHFNQPIEAGVLPSSLKTLSFFGNFNHPLIIPDTLPVSLTHLRLGMWFDHSISFRDLPSLTHLKLGHRYKDVESLENLPCSLTHLELSEKLWDLGIFPPNIVALRK